jgi:geranylgeranyl transferase type-2 subunit beta
LRNDLLESRSAGGGFAKTRGGKPSLYHAFLAALCFQLLGQEFPDADRAVAAVLSRQCSDGGFADVSGKHIEGTNPTAAAVGLLKVLGALDGARAERASTFVLGMQRSDGGFAAHPAAPASDLMSTFTALVALSDAGTIRRAHLGSAGRYVAGLALPTGGFLGFIGDNQPDIEYTYYGLGALALLAEQTAAG